eukprot:5634564-Ditylum_brightwellii.AAC.1
MQDHMNCGMVTPRIAILVGNSMLSSYYSTQWKGEWVQLNAGNAADSDHAGNNPLPNTLATIWKLPLETGNPVVFYQQNEKQTSLFNTFSTVLAYYGNNKTGHVIH